MEKNAEALKNKNNKQSPKVLYVKKAEKFNEALKQR
jgi:hypothetical protein